MRYYLFSKKFDYFKALGVPSKLNPSLSYDADIENSTKSFYKEVLEDYNDVVGKGKT